MPSPRFTMVVLLVDDLPRSLDFYRRLGVEFPPGAEERRDVQVPLGDDHQLVISTTFARNDPDRQPPSGGSRTKCFDLYVWPIDRQVTQDPFECRGVDFA